jgi:hypothetical protein
MDSTTLAVLSLVGALILHRVASFISDWRFSYANGCSPPPFKRSWDPIYGLDLAIEVFKAMQAGNRMKVGIERARQFNGTFGSIAFGKYAITTVEAANAHAVFVANNDCWLRKMPSINL